MRISLCQTSSGEDKKANLAAALKQLEQAAAQGAVIAVLPESLDFIGPRKAVFAIAEDPGGPFTSAISAKAKELGIWVVGGTTRTRVSSDRVANTLTVYDPNGHRRATYDKMHMFNVAIPGGVTTRESDAVQAGSQIVVVDIAGITSGLSVCFDLRFPELYRLQALAGAKILFVPSAFTTFTGRDHWEVLLRARAIENQCFVIAPNQSGSAIPEIPLFGNSLIVDPWGKVIARVTDDVGVVTADIDIKAVDTIRQRIPSLSARRDDVYTLCSSAPPCNPSVRI